MITAIVIWIWEHIDPPRNLSSIGIMAMITVYIFSIVDALFLDVVFLYILLKWILK